MVYIYSSLLMHETTALRQNEIRTRIDTVIYRCSWRQNLSRPLCPGLTKNAFATEKATKMIKKLYKGYTSYTRALISLHASASGCALCVLHIRKAGTRRTQPTYKHAFFHIQAANK